MSSNAIGTIIRIMMIAMFLIGYWVVSVGIVYYIVCLLTSINFSFKIWSILFFVVMLFRMFYPKNVFK
jgi:hypothetical protein